MRVVNQQKWDEAKLRLKGIGLFMSMVGSLIFAGAVIDGVTNPFTVMGCLITSLAMVSLAENIRHTH
jgi:hypothetical protein